VQITSDFCFTDPAHTWVVEIPGMKNAGVLRALLLGGRDGLVLKKLTPGLDV